MTDPIADLLTRIRNGSLALIPEVQLSHSNLKESIAQIMLKEGYVADVQVSGKPLKTIKIKLKYEGRKGIITGLKRVSRPGLRHYVNAGNIPRVLGGMGVAILSTPKGVMTGSEARKLNVGGEVLCNLW